MGSGCGVLIPDDFHLFVLWTMVSTCWVLGRLGQRTGEKNRREEKNGPERNLNEWGPMFAKWGP